MILCLVIDFGERVLIDVIMLKKVVMSVGFCIMNDGFWRSSNDNNNW